MQQDDAFLNEQLSSSVQVVGQPMAGVESAAVGILVGAGARDESPDQFGISHFTESMLFRGTERYDARALSEAFDSLGIDYDSSSGLEMTLLSAVLIGNRLPQALDLLAEVVRAPSFPNDSIDNVRTVILQEIRQREDRPAQMVMETLRQKFFADSPLGHDPLGTDDTLRRMGRDDLMGYWRGRYTASNLLISVAGNFDWDQTLAQLQELTATWPAGAGRSMFNAPASHAGITVLTKDSTQENIGFAFPGVAVSDERYYAAALMAQALGGSSNSRLFQEVREKRGLAYAVQARFDGLEQTGFFRVYVGTSAERAHESVEVVHAELDKLESDGITQAELDLAKTRLKSQVIMRSESTSARMAANLRSWWFEGKLHTLEDVRERIDRVTLDDIKELAGSIGIRRNLAVVALGPRSEDELFGNVLTGI